MNNVLITGGCGFIGGHLTKLLKDTYPGINITVVDDLRTPASKMSFWSLISRTIIVLILYFIWQTLQESEEQSSFQQRR